MTEDKKLLKSKFEPFSIEPFFSGGKASISADGIILATTDDSEVVVTNFETGKRIGRIRGVSNIINFP